MPDNLIAAVGPDIDLSKDPKGEKNRVYRFYPHFHPYTENLARRILVPSTVDPAGVPNLQAADTACDDRKMIVTNRVDGLAVLPQAVPVELGGGLYALLPTGTSVKLEEDGTEAVLSYDFLENRSPGTAFFLINQTGAWIIRFHSELNQPPSPPYEAVQLVAGTRAVLVDGKPLPEHFEKIFSWDRYRPTAWVVPPYPVKELDFEPIGPGSAYAVYNWELFYHIPIAIAIHLSRSQRFEEAKNWFHYVFNPEDTSDGPTPERFWKVKPLQTTDINSIEEILVNLSTQTNDKLRRRTVACIQKWMERPFRPHLVARFRTSAYMFKTVMAYLDNLIAWGDSLFRQDRPESVDDAADRYVEAMGILGPRPQAVPRKGTAGPSTYAKLKQYARTRGAEQGREFDAFGNILVELESDIPFADVAPAADADPGMCQLSGMGRESLCFCVPRNDKLAACWDTVADRLFKIHNSLNLMGVFRELPLFEPPIDPGLLAKGVAAGLDVSAIAEGLDQPLPQVRFQFLFQKAVEVCQEAKILGDKLLSVMEKEDGEALSILRARHESAVLELSEMVKYSQWQETVKSLDGLEKSYENAVRRFVYYERLLGAKPGDIQALRLTELESPKQGLEKLKFKSTEPSIAPREIDMDISDDAGGATGGKIKTLSSYEVEELQKLGDAQTTQDVAAVFDAIAGIVRVIPEISGDIKPIGIGYGISFGGDDLAAVLQIASGISRAVGVRYTFEANRAAKLGGYARREQEWVFQRNAAAGEINQIIKQYVGMQIREAIAEREWKNHKKQIEHARRIEEFLTNERNGKKTNQAFYAWMKREVKGLYGQSFRFAVEVARKAERALQHELGDRTLSFIQTGYLAGKEGLLAGEKLHADLRKMEMAYHTAAAEQVVEANVSLQQVDPLALIQLRATGSCAFSVPEEFFDLNCPGYYFRRIHAVAVSIPCVTGPYTGINATLTLAKSTIRKSPFIGEGYERAEGVDDRFEDNFELESIVASKGLNDNGRLQSDRSARDESQRAPFMGKGAVGEWHIELPADPSRKDPALFDYDTIADVVLHLQYTARPGGQPVKRKAMENIKAAIEEGRMAGSMKLFSIRHEFPVEWARYKTSPANHLEIELHERHFPFWSTGRLTGLDDVLLFAKTEKTSVKVNGDQILRKDRSLGGLLNGTLPAPESTTTPPVFAISLEFDTKGLDDLWLAVKWKNG
ncbi:MAG: hypothetical protein JXA71_13690 [Chitinispirillaceae bacterium]|nr:hypothetical protein [Chitinispirillaceae bacterium]